MCVCACVRVPEKEPQLESGAESTGEGEEGESQQRSSPLGGVRGVRSAAQSTHHGSVVTSPTSTCEDVGSIPDLARCIKDLVLPWAVV